MRILQFSDSFLPVMDGVGNVVYRYALNMGQKGHEVYVVAPQTDTGYRGGYPFEMVDYIGVPLPRMKSYTVGTPLLDPHCLNRLRIVRGDIVHVHSPFIAGQAGIQHARRRHLPVVGTFHSKYYDDFLQVTGVELLADVGVRHVVNFYEKCDEVWAVSASSAETLRSYGYRGDIRVMPNGTDRRDVSDEAVAQTAARFGLDGAVPMLLYVGQINWKKNLRRILEACARLDRPFRLVLAGQGPHRAAAQKLAEKLGIGDRVLFTGHISETETLDSLYRLADLFLFPSLYDTSGLVTREAAAQGTPAVVVENSSAAEGILDGENGFVCRDASESLAAAIESALSDPDRLRRVGLRAGETLPIPWHRLVDDVLAIYDEILERRSRKTEA